MGKAEFLRDIPPELFAYLLGRLPGAARGRIEERFFVEDELFETLCGVEEELICKYVRGELAGDVRRDFNARYMAWPPSRARVESARELARLSGGMGLVPSASRWRGLTESWLAFRGWGRPAIALAGMLLVAVTGWVAWRAAAFTRSTHALLAERAALEQRVHDLESTVRREHIQGSGAGVFGLFASFVLSPGMERANGATATLRIPANTQTVVLQLEVAGREERARFRARLQDAEGRDVWSSDVQGTQTAAGIRAVPAHVPASLLTPGDYVVLLKGAGADGPWEDLVSYSFRVAPR